MVGGWVFSSRIKDTPDFLSQTCPAPPLFLDNVAGDIFFKNRCWVGPWGLGLGGVVRDAMWCGRPGGDGRCDGVADGDEHC